MTAAELTAALGGRWSGSSGEARCPAHDDHAPSLSIPDGDCARGEISVIGVQDDLKRHVPPNWRQIGQVVEDVLKEVAARHGRTAGHRFRAPTIDSQRTTRNQTHDREGTQATTNRHQLPLA